MVSVRSALPEIRATPRRVKLLKTDVSRRTAWILRAASILVPLAGWWALSVSGLVEDTFLPSPPDVWAAGLTMIESGDLPADLLASLGRIGAGFGLAVLISVPLGFAMGTLGWAQPLLEPVIGILRYLPASAFIPLLIIWLGIGETSKIALLVLGVVFFNTLMTADVVRQVPARLLEVSAILGAGRARVAARVVFPYALPGILDAMRVNAAAAWNFVVVAELIAATSGLGYRITRAQRFLQTDRIFAILIVIGLIGLTIDITLRLVRARVGRWAL
ncbi:ABC transporter permease [Acrocarpospora pleiomorpha]|uniref:ABC transporter permease n=1 Tax=Acrocarpospora pleiomorpha TaxID=90975 RepID=A0A5M3XUV5_9ACTN|nr:ABC transporter permease [Acrocarpospora pleiomorpha]GES24987.1 ABC transporter permease [Acrocarpospora pleiomorpha]